MCFEIKMFSTVKLYSDLWTFKAYSSIGKNTFSILIREDKHLAVYYAFNEIWML